MKDTQLYIADTLVDLDTDSIITLNYILEDTNNPTIVKNSFSKSITLPATDTNNKLFGHIYNLSRETILDGAGVSGARFNTLKRTPFQLFVEGQLIESGYVQLTSIKLTNGQPRYTIQAYGGLGDFLYNLMYDEEGDKLTLASLNYGIDGFTGDAKDELTFSINKDIVNNAWNSLPNSGRNAFSEVVTFVPAYNGVSEDFDGKHAVFNYAGTSDMLIPRYITSGSTQYSSLNGYGCLEFERKLDESETRDLRSYLQRPALSVKALFDACCKPENNGGYTVNLDSAFFNEENTMYWDSYITLPMLSTDVESEDSVINFNNATGFIGGSTNKYISSNSLAAIDISSAPTNAMININVGFSLVINSAEHSKLHTDIDVYEEVVDEMGLSAYEYSRSYNSAIIAQIVIYSTRGDILAASNEVVLSSQGKFKKTWKTYTKLDDIDRGLVFVNGSFERDGNKCVFVSTAKNNTFLLNASMPRGAHQSIRVELRVQRAFPEASPIGAGALYISNKALLGSSLGTGNSIDEYIAQSNIITIGTSDSSAEITTDHLPSISSNSLVTKDILLGNTETPADYLLSYIKLFNLRIIKDVASKTISITPNYFTGEVVDLSECIDRGQSTTITPNVANKKYLRLGLEQPETYFSQKYRDMNNLDYGQKRIDTGYTFNNETEEIYENNVFTSAVPCLSVSRLYYTHYNKSSKEVFNVLAENPKLVLANGLNEAAGFTTASEQLLSTLYIDTAKAVPFNINKGYDIMPRMCYFTESGEGRDSVDIANNLVVYSGNRALTNINGGAVSYWITDDIPEMIHLAGKNCYLLTNDIYPEGIKCAKLPLFLSMRLSSTNNVLSTFDFARSKEHYIPGISYPDGVTMYEKYWHRFYTDRLHVDTCKVTCFVDLSGIVVDNSLLRKFFYFDNNYWLLNKISDYNPTKDKLTKCEFIKVRNTSTYFTPNIAEDIDVE